LISSLRFWIYLLTGKTENGEIGIGESEMGRRIVIPEEESVIPDGF